MLKLTLPCSDAERFATVPERRRYVDTQRQEGAYSRNKYIHTHASYVLRYEAAEACDKRGEIMRAADERKR